MGTECTTHEPLLLSSKPPLLSGNDQEDHGFRYAAKTPFPVTFIKWVLKSAMWLIFIAWASFMFFLPLKPVNEFNQKIEKATSGTIFGETGSYFLIFTAPVLLIAFLAIIYLMISGEEDLQEKKKPKHPRFRLWTFPVIVDGPFGVVNAAEFIGILLFAIYVIWAVTVYTIRNYGLLSMFQGFGENGRYLMQMLELTGLRFGFIGLICLAFLFLPVARGSVLLRLIDIPFEHATRYHVWLGHLTMLLFTLHGLFYVIAWAMQGNLIQELMAWKNFGVANLPGVVSLVAGLFMWVTSLDPVRRQKFELFFYTHQLYVVFVVFLALHVGDFLFMIVGGGIFLFMLDRFLRFFQSRKTVDILSAKCLPSGTVELVISKPHNLQYNALSWVFVQVPKLSWLQWHPFSVSSSPLDGKHHLAILIKVLGDWTEKLRGHISSVSNEQGETGSLLQTSFNMKASVEGPYGHESPYHLTYENLILVAGGIGISPFMAILRDILHHIRDNKPCLPRNVLIVWAVKKSNELSLLDSIDMESLCPNFYSALNLEIQTYVTRESEPPLEEGKIQKYVTPSSFPATSGRGMSSLVGTGNIKWSGTYLVVSTLGLVITVGMLDAFYIKPYNIRYWWYKGLLLMICMAVSVIVFGGFVIGLWHLWDKRTSTVEKTEDENRSNGVQHNGSNVYNNGSEEGFVNTVKYGKRPDFEEIFGTTAKRWGNVDIGVMVCGPAALQTSIAKECRSKNLGRRSDDPVFHFNSHSFDL